MSRTTKKAKTVAPETTMSAADRKCMEAQREYLFFALRLRADKYEAEINRRRREKVNDARNEE